MKDVTRFKTGLACTCLAAICCLTPVLVISLGAIGLSAALGWLDYVLLPALAISAVMTIHAAIRLLRRRRNA
ncbi:MAG: mercuric ion transport protein [Alphaproteobacteria bacterium]|jgi:mercuric ion transport protein